MEETIEGHAIFAITNTEATNHVGKLVNKEHVDITGGGIGALGGPKSEVTRTGAGGSVVGVDRLKVPGGGVNGKDAHKIGA